MTERQQRLAAELSAFRNDQDRLAWLVQQARQRPALDASFKTDSYRVQGCLSKLWLVSECRDDRCFFRCDSDSQIVKAISGLICDYYSELTPQEILASDPKLLTTLGITQHLTPNRRNALSRVWETICEFARKQI